MARHIFVVGGAGYIGSHTCKALAAQGYVPVTLDNLVYGHEWAVKWGPFTRVDILDRPGLDECFARYRPEAVMHFAAFTYVGESVRDPGKYYQNNVAGTVNLLEAMRAAGCSRFIFSSSCAVYGIPTRLPLTEDHGFAPINPYGTSKLMVEQMLRDYAKAYGQSSMSLRYFNAAGADPDGESGECHDPETHLIPLALRAALDPDSPLTVFGSDYDTPDGTCIRDYVHVADLAQAHVLALDLLREPGLARALNLGNGTGYSVRQVIDTVSEVSGLPVAWKAGERREGDPSRLVADSSRARAELGWQPRHERLGEIVEHAWRWAQGRPECR
ncbi:UDP-glucose 4-epimerase [Desulfovibrio sp. X2]|uniref:UDP-glucose 4-epimerase GalE n=1 Tax=Desulfovibrio sp. X2 TaxID=941449 RepID=UPI000358E38D|nr:UDP-glucose 4-epimerase GalE [Desulfovibrio sp. X2]EPR41811.1 UDP-glucose 4-epimerase [Desulfovibrio sp. X2]